MTLIDKAEALAILAPAPNAKDGLWAKRKQALYEQIAALPARGVGVKPLVWEDRGGVDYVSDRYVVQVFFGSDQYYFETWDLSLGQKLYDGDDLPSAQAAAQRDYEARILTTLAPTDAAQAREAALRQAAKRVSELMVHKPASPTEKDYNMGVGVAYDAILALIGEKPADPQQAREAALREAADAVSRAAWKHLGDDSYSAGLEDGARKQNEADYDAILALLTEKLHDRA